MKRFIYSMLVVFSLLSILNAQTPSDYYIPLQVGNQLTYRSGNEESTWAPRTVYETIEGSDSLFGKIFYKQVGSEFMDDSPTEEHIFHVFWLREDSLGNIIIGAVGLGDSRELDSAMVYPMEYPFLEGESLVPGYSRHYEYQGMSILDSTISNTETVITGTGTFSNCIKMMEYRIDSSGAVVWEKYSYFAENVGEVKLERITPDAHINNLTHINFQTNIDALVPENVVLKQNYPNPFNPVTKIDYSIPLADHVLIKVYDLHGREIQTLCDKYQRAGDHSVIFRAGDMSSGVYIYTLQVGERVASTRKMVFLK